MEKEFVPYKEALALKELGFNESCFGYYKHTTIPNKIIENTLIICFIKDMRIYNDKYNGHSLNGLGKGFVFAPLYQQAFKWFRTKYPDLNPVKNLLFLLDKNAQADNLLSYEELELECLRNLIKIVK